MAHAWEARPAHNWDATTDDSDSSGDALTPEDAGRELVDMLVSMRLNGRISAREACVLAHWAHCAGAVGDVKVLGFRPGAASGSYQRHFDMAVGYGDDKDRFTTIAVPGHAPHDLSRTVHHVSVWPPHEAIAEELGADGTVLAELREAVVAHSLPPAYERHPCVQGSDAPPLPLALYLDGTPYTKRDSVLAIVLQNLVSQRRHLLCVLRKSTMCACGCRGWCSVYPILRFLKWGLLALMHGEYPTTDWAGRSWGDAEATRKGRGGKPLPARGVCLFMKGDWAEFTATLGFPTWQSTEWPCLWCSASRDSLFLLDGASPEGEGFAPTDTDSYERACERCEIAVCIRDGDAHLRIRSLLV